MADEMQMMAHEIKTCKAKESRLKTDLNKLISEMATLEKQRQSRDNEKALLQEEITQTKRDSAA